MLSSDSWQSVFVALLAQFPFMYLGQQFFQSFRSLRCHYYYYYYYYYYYNYYYNYYYYYYNYYYYYYYYYRCNFVPEK